MELTDSVLIFSDVDSGEISPFRPISISPILLSIGPSFTVASSVQNGPQVALEG